MTLQATELRIGNYILFKGKIISISPIGLRDLYYSADNTGECEYAPIPLTPEFLDKHFKYNDGYFDCYEIGNGLQINYVTTDEYPELEILTPTIKNGDLGYEKKVIGIKHLHQLQNLYFAFTQTELNINL